MRSGLRQVDVNVTVVVVDLPLQGEEALVVDGVDKGVLFHHIHWPTTQIITPIFIGNNWK